LFAGAFRNQLFHPIAKADNRWREDESGFIPAGVCQLAEQRAQPGGRIIPDWCFRSAIRCHFPGAVEKARQVYPA
jgi:hypothetical protein